MMERAGFERFGTPLFKTLPHFAVLACLHKVMGQEGAEVYPRFADEEREVKSCAQATQ